MATWTVQPSGGDYTTLAAALSNASTAANDTIEISGDWTSTTDTSAATVSDDNITIQTKSGDQARHAGFDNEGTNYELAVSGSHCITVNNTGCIIDGLIIKQAGTGSSDEGIRLSGDHTLTVKNSIIWTPAKNTDQDGIYVGNNSVTINVEQCFIYGFDRGGFSPQHHGGGNKDQTLNANSCGIWDCGKNYNQDRNEGGTKTWNIHNCWGAAADTADYATAPTVTWNISNSMDSDNTIAGLLDTGSGNFASRTIRDATAGGDELLVNDITTAPFDLTLIDDATNNDAQDAHSNATAHSLTIPTSDIAGTTRSSSYEIGPFTISTSSGVTVTAVKSSLSLSTVSPSLTGISILAGTNQLSLTTKNPSLTGLSLLVGKISTSLVTKTPTLTTGESVTVVRKSGSITTNTPTLLTGVNINVGKVTVSVNTKDPTISAFSPIEVVKAALSIITKEPTISASAGSILVEKVTFSMASKVPQVSGGHVLTFNPMTLSISTKAPIASGGDLILSDRVQLSLITKVPKLPMENWTQITKSTNATFTELSKGTDQTWTEISKGTDQNWKH